MAAIREDEGSDGLLVDTFEQLSRYVVSDHSLDGTLQLVADLSVSAVAGADAASISLARGGKYLTAASTSRGAVEADELQYAFQSGPCVDAMRLGAPQWIDSILTEKRWPEFTNKAMYSGFQSVVSFPFNSGPEVLGAINLYSHAEAAFGEHDHVVGKGFADRSTVILLNAVAYAAATELADQLQQALQSRAVIDQAKGILIVRERISADEAFNRLKIASQAENVKVRDLAQTIVQRAQEGFV